MVAAPTTAKSRGPARSGPNRRDPIPTSPARPRAIPILNVMSRLPLCRRRAAEKRDEVAASHGVPLSRGPQRIISRHEGSVVHHRQIQRHRCSFRVLVVYSHSQGHERTPATACFRTAAPPPLAAAPQAGGRRAKWANSCLVTDATIYSELPETDVHKANS
jgi:hypothetical protein